MSDVFEENDLQRIQNALNEANAERNRQKIKEADIDKKDDQYNERLSTLTEPFAQEFLRKPVEDIPKGIASAVKKRVGKGLNYLKGEAEKQVDKRVAQLSDRLNLPDLGEQGKSLLSGDFSSFLPKASDLDEVAGKARATLSPFNEDALDTINRARASGGQSLLKSSDEAVEVDAFTGKPVVPKVTQKKPLFDDVADDDWTSDLYDKPITHTSRLFEDRPSVRLPDTPAPPSLTGGGGITKTSSLESILPLDEAKTDLSSVDFKFKRPIQPASKAVAKAGDEPEVLDQLAPMRDAMKSQRSPLSQSEDAVARLAPPVEAPAPDLETPPAPKPTLGGSASEDGARAVSGTSKEVVSKDISKPLVDLGKGAGSEDFEKAGAKALGTFAETDAEFGGPEDIIGDVISGIAGLATLFGGEFGKHHTVTPVEVPTIASSQKGVF